MSVFHLEVVATGDLVEVPDRPVYVAAERAWVCGSLRVADVSGTEYAPAASNPPEEPPAPAGNLRPTPPEFMATMFSFQERVAIRAARHADVVVDDFLRLIEDPRLTFVDLTLPSTRDAILYLTQTDPLLLTPERAEQILGGQPAPPVVAT